MTTHCTHHTQCPECARIGHDRDRNNLAVYSDGSAWCFKCGYLLSASGIEKLKKSITTEHGNVANAVVLPADVAGELPEKAWDYLKQYELTKTDILNATVLWSEYHQRLIFPYFDDQGLIGWQGRYLGTEKTGYQGSKRLAKWYGLGKLDSMIHVVGNSKGRSCVLTEDIISALKVAHNPAICASPILGSHISVKRLLRLKLLFDTIYIWLDKDKQKESIKYSKTAQLLGLTSYVIITDKDPKEHTDEQIKDILNGFTST